MIAGWSIALAGLTTSPIGLMAQKDLASGLHREIDARLEQVLPKVVAWRRDVHQRQAWPIGQPVSPLV